MPKLSQKNKLTIGLDLDDTIRDHDINRKKLLKKLKKKVVDDELRKILYTNISLDCPPVKNSIEVIDNFIDNGYKVIVVSRNKKDGQPYAREWLKKYLPKIQPRKVFFVKTDEEKNLVCLKEKVDLFIDDSQKVIDHLDPKIKKFLFIRNWKEIGKEILKSI